MTSTDRTEVCSPGYARARRVWNDKASTLAKYDIPMSRIREFDVLSRCDALGDQVAAALDVDEAVIDGEVIAADETGRPQFHDLLRGTSSPCYIAFDLVWLNGADLRPLPLYERRRALQGMLLKGSKILSEALSVAGRGRELFDLMCAHDLEGVVPKRFGDRSIRSRGMTAMSTIMPKRVQLRRTKGWRKPEGTVSVARPTRWGNPFKAGDVADPVAEFRSNLPP